MKGQFMFSNYQRVFTLQSAVLNAFRFHSVHFIPMRHDILQM